MIDPLDMNVPEIGKKIESIPVEQVMEAMQSLETELKEFYASQALDLEDAIARVRELHKQIDGIGVKVCAVCIDDRMYWTEQTNYPCDTIKALDGEQ